MTTIPKWLEDLLVEHFEELQMLWDLRKNSVRDPDFTSRAMRELDERIESHIDALMLSKSDARGMIVEGLESGEPLVTAAAVMVLLRDDDHTVVDLIAKSLEQAEDEGLLDALGEAFCVGPISSMEVRLHACLTHGNGKVATVAALALAFHGKLDERHPRIAELILDESPWIRERSWRVVGFLGR